jgi:diguanylate cyclase (GGDEF)-like protein
MREHAAFEGDDADGETELFAGKILEMIQVRGSDALPGWLASKFSSLYAPARGRVLRVFPGPAARSRTIPRYAVFSMDEPLLQDPPRLLSIDAVLVETIQQARPWTLTQASEGARLLVTLTAGGEVRYVVELVGQLTDAQVKRLAAFAAIASRYFDRLIDAETDPLTRLCNRRAFQAQLDTSLRRWTASGRPWFFAVLDIDHFKRINDDFGHLYGDEILVRFAQLMRQTFRAGDLLYRFGGEEFVAIYGVDEEAGAVQPLERFRKVVEQNAFPGVGQVSVSIGYTRIPDAATPTTTLIDRADHAMYFAKAQGRNRVCHWETLIAAGAIQLRPPAPDVTYFD